MQKHLAGFAGFKLFTLQTTRQLLNFHGGKRLQAQLLPVTAHPHHHRTRFQMLVVAACFMLIALTTLIHYEALGLLSTKLARLRIPPRRKLLVVIFSAFLAHAIEITVYGLAIYGLIVFLHAGNLTGPAGFSLKSSLYFSAETYTSLGFGDLTPSGTMRLIAGVEALNGLLMIGWTASYTYIAMERFWKVGHSVAAPGAE